MRVQKITLVLLLVANFISYGQVPVNDECAGAIELTVNADNTCTSSAIASLINATPSDAQIDSNSYFYNGSLDDVWFFFTATSESHSISLSPMYLPVAEVYSGICGSALIPLGHAYSHIPLVVSELTIGEKYYVRVAMEQDPDVDFGDSIGICVNTVSPPENDTCINAITINDNESIGYEQSVGGTTFEASADFDYTGNPEIDVWYRFVATDTSYIISLFDQKVFSEDGQLPNDSWFSDAVPLKLDLYKGSCSAPEQINESEFLYKIIYDDPVPVDYAYQRFRYENLDIGEEYLLRVWHNKEEVTDQIYEKMEFSVCINRMLSYNTNISPIEIVASDQTQTYGPSLVGQIGTTDQLDLENQSIEFRFMAPERGFYSVDIDTVQLRNLPNTTEPIRLVWSMGVAGNFNCDTVYNPNISSILANQGEEVIINVRAAPGCPALNAKPYGNLEKFNIRLHTTLVPENDECQGAIEIPVNSSVECTTDLAGSTFYATDSQTGFQCENNSKDVWYKFTASANTVNVDISIPEQSIELIKGTCSNMEYLGCYNIDTTPLTNLAVGDEYYLKLSTFTRDIEYEWVVTYANYDICITEVAPPTNNTCSTPNPLTVFEENNSSGQETQSTTFGATNSDTISSCGTDTDLDLFYNFTMPADETNLNVILSGDGANTAQLALYDGCNGNEIVNCNGRTETFTGLTPGQTYLLQIWHPEGSAANFSIALEAASSLGIDFSRIEDFKLHPNPVDDVLSFSALENIEKISLFNLLGKELISIEIQALQGVLPTENLPEGIYFIEVFAEGKRNIHKIIKK